jgi:hypothetical protein
LTFGAQERNKRQTGQERPSCLKKRSKKLLLLASSRRSLWADWVLPVTDKGLLVHFFKKELIPFRFACAP